mmetsp:Transcript_81797/g.136733  ORF Transcript_81797/g.136733 Transcript_81797/m.136733 type:complete len:442 (+) Transcript_81797:1420-2745(+)
MAAWNSAHCRLISMFLTSLLRRCCSSRAARSACSRSTSSRCRSASDRMVSTFASASRNCRSSPSSLLSAALADDSCALCCSRRASWIWRVWAEMCCASDVSSPMNVACCFSPSCRWALRSDCRLTSSSLMRRLTSCRAASSSRHCALCSALAATPCSRFRSPSCMYCSISARRRCDSCSRLWTSRSCRWCSCAWRCCSSSRRVASASCSFWVCASSCESRPLRNSSFSFCVTASSDVASTRNRTASCSLATTLALLSASAVCSDCRSDTVGDAGAGGAAGSSGCRDSVSTDAASVSSRNPFRSFVMVLVRFSASASCSIFRSDSCVCCIALLWRAWCCVIASSVAALFRTSVASSSLATILVRFRASASSTDARSGTAGGAGGVAGAGRSAAESRLCPMMKLYHAAKENSSLYCQCRLRARNVQKSTRRSWIPFVVIRVTS